MPLKSLEIENQTKTSLLIEYLEAVIVDEMILNSFIRNIKVINFNQNNIYLEIPNQTNINFLRKNYLNLLKQGINEIFEAKLKIIFKIPGENENYELLEKKLKNNISKKFSFNNYIVSEFNQDVVKIAKELYKNPGKFSPFYVSSKSGLGKTHLLHSIGNDFIKNGLNALYIEPNAFTRKIQTLSKKSGDAISNYIDEFKEYDLVLFDDIQNLGDRSVTLKVLFNIINLFLEKDKQIVIVADKSAYELNGFEERFKTRFTSGIISKIKDPSTEDLIKILEFKLSIENLKPEKWEKEAIRFIVRNNSSSIRAIEGAVKRISFFTMNESNIKYTYSVISSIFSDLTIDQKELTPNRIIKVVANYYKITKNDIIGKSKKKEFVLARHIAMWFIRKIKNLSFVEIGKIIGNRDHSTVISAIKGIDFNIKVNKTVKTALGKIEERIKTIN